MECINCPNLEMSKVVDRIINYCGIVTMKQAPDNTIYFEDVNYDCPIWCPLLENKSELND